MTQQSLVGTAVSDERGRAVMRTADYRCQMDACGKRAAYVTTDGRAACGCCRTPPRLSMSSGGDW